MKLEDQVLSIKQVQELQELGFDIKKHSSMYYTPNWITKFGVDEIQDYLLQIGGLGEDDDGDCIPTMTIGDIIDVLPEVLDRPRIIHRNYYLFITKLAVSYSNRDRYDHEFIRYIETKNPNFHPFENKKSFIICLFEALKWCIKEKHI